MSHRYKNLRRIQPSVPGTFVPFAAFGVKYVRKDGRILKDLKGDNIVSDCTTTFTGVIKKGVNELAEIFRQIPELRGCDWVEFVTYPIVKRRGGLICLSSFTVKEGIMVLLPFLTETPYVMQW